MMAAATVRAPAFFRLALRDPDGPWGYIPVWPVVGKKSRNVLAMREGTSYKTRAAFDYANPASLLVELATNARLYTLEPTAALFRTSCRLVDGFSLRPSGDGWPQGWQGTGKIVPGNRLGNFLLTVQVEIQ